MFVYFQKLQNYLWKWFYILQSYISKDITKDNIKFAITKTDCFLPYFSQKFYRDCWILNNKFPPQNHVALIIKYLIYCW